MAVLAKDLRAAVLQAAIQGKLTKQLPEDGDARDLLTQIKAEKEQLIKDKKIKKEKLLAPIDEDEIPFDIPDNWCWVHLPDVAISSLGKTLNKAKDTGDIKPYLCSINVYWTGYNDSVIKTAKFTENEKNKYALQKGDLLICEGGDAGRSMVWNFDDEMYYQNALHCVRFFQNINPYYFWYLLLLYKNNGTIDNVSKGIGLKHLVQEALYSLIFPLPPLAEQHRIVARVEELMFLIDEYEKIEKQLEELKEKFSGDMKAALLQAAMQGKLTGNNYCEDDDDSIFTPLWTVTWWDKKFQKVEKSKQDKTISYYYYLAAEMKALEQPSGDVFLLSTGDYKGWTTSEKAKGTVSEGEVVTIPWGGFPYVKYYKGKFVTTDNRIATSKDTTILSNKFLYYFMLSKVEFLDSIYRGTGLRHPDMGEVLEMNIPIMPIEEQQRIVDILDKLLPLCEELYN